LRISLLRSAGYAALPLEERRVMPKDRFSPHIDMGDRAFNIRIAAGKNLLDFVDSEAEVFNQPPYALSFFPDGSGEAKKPFVEIDDKHIILSSLRRAGDGYSLRLFNASPEKREAVFRFPFLSVSGQAGFGGFEAAEFRVTRHLVEKLENFE
jgi:alpha-mannosidase